jgi:hypothetical protein
VLRMLLGAQLRRLRESASVTRDDAGYHIRASGSKISRMELGRVSFKERDVTDLLEFYGIDDAAEKEKLVQLTREANATPWYQKFQDVVPDWFHVFVGLEEAAQLIRVYEVQFVPGLLQTEEYARALIRVSRHDATDEEVERLVALRMGRQDIFASPTPPRVWYVIDEAAFRRTVGGIGVMAVQLDKLIAVASAPGNVIQVFPFAASAGLGGDGPLMIYEFPANDPVVGYAECYRGGRLVQDVAEGSEMLTKLNLIRACALSPGESVAWMRKLRSELGSE